MRSQSITPTPLFNAPGVRSSIFRLDGLHVADLGVSADWLGGLFTFLAELKFPGRSFAAKLSGLWQRIQQLYRVHPPAARLDQLTDKMLNRGSPSTKLRCYGMEVRCLIPVAKDPAQEYLREADLVEQAIRQGTLELSACNDCLSRSAPGGELATRSRKFATLLVSLEVHLPGVFRVKPKLHFFQEMYEQDLPGRPSSDWTYREEEFGGSVARLGMRRGGSNTPGAVGRQTLLKFVARHQLHQLD